MGGDRLRKWKGRVAWYVSIHAPAWGATDLGTKHEADDVVSIHAPAWGATAQDAGEHDNAVVSIHAPAWGATDGETPLNQKGYVSIHAPAWGATSYCNRRPERPSCFNPRPRMGGDDILAANIQYAIMFQSTPPHGGRHMTLDESLGFSTVSIHAPAWGATRAAR